MSGKIEVVSPDMVIEEGVACEFNGKYWGKLYSDGCSTSFGWGGIETARISDPRFCTKPSNMTYKGSHDEANLEKGKLIRIRRTITAERI